MPFSVLSVTIILLFAVIMFRQIRNSLERGLNRSVQSLVNITISLTIAIIISPSVSRFIVDRLYPIISEMGFYRDMHTTETVNVFIRAAASIILSSVFYLILFCFIRLILHVILLILLPERDPETPEYEGGRDSWAQRNSKMLTVLCGSLSAVMLTTAITAPIMGSLNVASRAIKLTKSVTDISLIDEDVQILYDLEKDIPGNLFYSIGGEFIYSAVASADIYGNRVYLVNELSVIEDTASELLELMPALEDLSSFSADDSKKIDEVCKNVQKIKLAGVFLAEIIAEWSKAWLNNQSYMGVSMPKMNESLRSVFYEMLVVCTITDVYSVKSNIVTLLRVMAIIAESGMLSAEDGNTVLLMNLLSENKVLDAIDEELAKNPNMYSVRKQLPNMVLGEISGEIKNGKYDSEKYEVLLNQLANSLAMVQGSLGSQESKVNQLANYTKEHMSDFGFEITEYIAEIAAETLLTELAVLNGEVTPADIDSFFLEFLK